MHSLLQRTTASFVEAVCLRGPLCPKKSVFPALTTRLHAGACKARAGEDLGEPSKPVKDALLPKPEEPGPEDCCQSGCSLCVWDMYQDNLHEYRVQQAMLKGETPPVKALDPFEEMELKLDGLLKDGKGSKASQAEPATD